MNVLQTGLPEVLLLAPRVFRDERGFFFERYNKREFAAATGVDPVFVQDNHSSSKRNVVRGLHYQVRQSQGKLIWVAAGQIFDVAVDMRGDSSRFGKWTGFMLSAANGHMAWIPAGFAHGFLAMSENSQVEYKCTDFYAPAHERTLLWNDPSLGIDWPLNAEPILAKKDQQGMRLEKAECVF